MIERPQFFPLPLGMASFTGHIGPVRIAVAPDASLAVEMILPRRGCGVGRQVGHRRDHGDRRRGCNRHKWLVAIAAYYGGVRPR